MPQIVRDWCGCERVFALNAGAVMDLEEALGQTAIGVVFRRLTHGEYSVRDVYHTIRIALITGEASPVDVKRLMGDPFDRVPLMQSAALAVDILLAMMTGVEPDDGPASDSAPEPLKFSELSQICRVFNMSPGDLRAMRYADLINMLRGFNAVAGGPKLEHLSEAEFEDILARHEPEALTHG